MESTGEAGTERIRQLEKIARQLDPGAGKREEVRRRVVDYSEHFLNHLENLPAFISGREGDGIKSFAIGEEPMNAEL
ncbi:MAG: hypothetical protein NZM08_09580, partial [Chitinophagales bacterium]|nr:hypothetical protein [Chitinophagales bacterium]